MRVIELSFAFRVSDICKRRKAFFHLKRAFPCHEERLSSPQGDALFMGLQGRISYENVLKSTIKNVLLQLKLFDYETENDINSCVERGCNDYLWAKRNAQSEPV